MEKSRIEQKLGKMRATLKYSKEDLERIEKALAELNSANLDKVDVLAKFAMLEKQLEELENVVENMSDKDLEELSKYKSPPERIRFFLEGLFYLLKERKFEWDQIKKEMMGGEFKKLIKNFKGKTVKPEVLKTMYKNYTSHPDWDLKKLKNASKIMGPFGEWMEMQMEYLKTQSDLAPKMAELNNFKLRQSELEKERAKTISDIDFLSKNITELEEIRIDEYNKGLILPLMFPERELAYSNFSILCHKRTDLSTPEPKVKEIDPETIQILQQPHTEVARETNEVGLLTDYFQDDTFVKRTKETGASLRNIGQNGEESGPFRVDGETMISYKTIASFKKISTDRNLSDLESTSAEMVNGKSSGETEGFWVEAGVGDRENQLVGGSNAFISTGKYREDLGGQRRPGFEESLKEIGVGERENQLVGGSSADINIEEASENKLNLEKRKSGIESRTRESRMVGGSEAFVSTEGEQDQVEFTQKTETGVGSQENQLVGGSKSFIKLDRILGRLAEKNRDLEEVEGSGQDSESYIGKLRSEDPSVRNIGVGNRSNALSGISRKHLEGFSSEDTRSRQKDAATTNREDQMVGESEANISVPLDSFKSGVKNQESAKSQFAGSSQGFIRVEIEEEVSRVTPVSQIQSLTDQYEANLLTALSNEQGVQSEFFKEKVKYEWTGFADKQVQAEFESEKLIETNKVFADSKVRYSDHQNFLVETNIQINNSIKLQLNLQGKFDETGNYCLEWIKTSENDTQLLEAILKQDRVEQIRGRAFKRPGEESLSRENSSASSFNSKKHHTCKKHSPNEHSQLYIDLMNELNESRR